jgi:hypothetical protein
MFINGVVGVCPHGRELRVSDVQSVARLEDGRVLYVGKCGDGVTITQATHRHATQWLRAKVTGDTPMPSDEELQLIEFEVDLEHVNDLSDLEALWANQ